jgi:hypothetical protein
MPTAVRRTVSVAGLAQIMYGMDRICSLFPQNAAQGKRMLVNVFKVGARDARRHC